MADRNQKALAEFVSEAQENIDLLGRDVMRLDGHAGEPDPELLNAVFREAHTLKGLSSMFGVERMTRLAHALEDLLDDVRMGRRPIDRSVLDLLLETPEVFSRIVAEEAGGAPAATLDVAAGLAERLRAGAPVEAAGGEDPLDAVALGPELRRMLTEYEEHRLRTSVRAGLGLFRVRVAFAEAAFDKDLPALTRRIKPLGEVIATLPATEGVDPSSVGLELLLATARSAEEVSHAVAEASAVEPVARLRPVAPDRGPGGTAAAPPAPLRAEAGPAASPPVAGAAAGSPAVAGASAGPSAGATGGGPPGGGAIAEADTASLRSASQSVRVDIRKLDRLMNVVGDLVLVKSALLGIAERLKAEGTGSPLAAELQRANRTLERKLDEIQGGILEVRMVPLEQIFDKLTRMVRKLAREVGKEIDFEVSGGDVELDKLIVEELSDPLMHLIRNAIDHAIEAPEERARLGKPRAGRVTLSAVQRGNHVRIVVADDGGGIDEERIREVAVARGLASAATLAELGRREVMNLIFVPGFSTARQVTNLSGRGVGMDVVKNNIAALSGIIDLQSERGAGTRFAITLPVTLAIVRALVVSAAGRVYAIPLNSVLEILEVRSADLRTLSTREVLTLRGATLPITRLARHFALAGERPVDPFFVVVVGLAQERLGIAVDELVGQQDIVTKPLGRLLRGTRGISGATDLGNRRTVLVLDVGAIIEDVVAGERAVERPAEAAG